MSFVNIKKVVLEDTTDPRQAMANVALTLISIVHDLVQEEKYDDAKIQLQMAVDASHTLYKVLDKYNSPSN